MTDLDEGVREAIRAIADQAPSTVNLELRSTARREVGRRRAVLVSAVMAAAVVFVGVLVAVVLPRGSGGTVTVTGNAGNGVTRTLTLPAGPLTSRYGAATAWSGHEWLIWGGLDNHNRPMTDGAAFDPATGHWSYLPAAPLAGRVSPASIWTGTEWIIWGGSTDHAFVDGAAFNPSTGRWLLLPPAPTGLSDPANAPTEAVWTGTEMIVLADSGAAAYRPSTETWTKLPAAPGQTSDPPQAVWTGSVAVFLVGSPRVAPSKPVTPVSLAPMPGAPATSGDTHAHQAGPSTPAPVNHGRYTLVTYDPDTGRWGVLPNGGLSRDGQPDIVWDGHQLLTIDLWPARLTGPGGTTVLSGANAAYDPRTNHWTTLPAAPRNGRYPISPATWTGTAVLLWDGGQKGLAYHPASRTWSIFAAPRAPSLFQPVTVWTGRDLLVWGGENDRSSASDTTRAAGYQAPAP